MPPKNYVHRTTCRLCASLEVVKVVDLEPIPLAEFYGATPEEGRTRERFPVDLYMCGACGHVQLLDVVDPGVLWDSYTYFSGEAKGMPEHFETVAEEVRAKIDLPDGALVIDIGSNDGSLLKPFQRRGATVLGIDPATEVARRANADGVETICALMSLDLARKIRAERGLAKVVCAFNVFAHADDLGDMVASIAEMLDDDGLFFFEAQYLADIVDGMLIATIFHEHMSHHSLIPLMAFLDRCGLELIDVRRVQNVQHGSIVGTVQKKGGARPVSAAVTDLVAQEKARGLDKVETLRAFGEKVAVLRAKTAVLAAGWAAEGARIAGFGAARSGPTLVEQMGLAGKLDFIVDDHPQKVGKFTSGHGIPVHASSELTERMPEYCVILAWVHSARIIQNNRDYLEKGGKFVVLCPETRVVGKDGDIPI